jgi:hypothetical protein
MTTRVLEYSKRMNNKGNLPRTYPKRAELAAELRMPRCGATVAQDSRYAPHIRAVHDLHENLGNAFHSPGQTTSTTIRSNGDPEEGPYTLGRRRVQLTPHSTAKAASTNGTSSPKKKATAPAPPSSSSSSTSATTSSRRARS